jgi:hypothetical protein
MDNDSFACLGTLVGWGSFASCDTFGEPGSFGVNVTVVTRGSFWFVDTFREYDSFLYRWYCHVS